MAFSTSEITLKPTHTKGNQSLSTLRRPIDACKLSRRFYFCHFGRSGIYFCLGRCVDAEGRSWRRWTIPFSSASCSLTQQRLLMSKAPCSLNYFDVFISLSCIFSIFSIKIPPILVNTSPSHTRQKIDLVVATGVNNVVLHPMNSIVNNVVEPCWTINVVATCWPDC